MEPSFSLPFNTKCKMYVCMYDSFPLEFMKILYSEGKDCSFSIETVDHWIIWVTNIKSVINNFCFLCAPFLSFWNLNRKQKKLELSFQDTFFSILYHLGRSNICWIKSVNIHELFNSDERNFCTNMAGKGVILWKARLPM